MNLVLNFDVFLVHVRAWHAGNTIKVDERRCYNTDATALQWPGGVLVESARKKMKAIHDLIVSATWKYLSHARPLPSEQ